MTQVMVLIAQALLALAALHFWSRDVVRGLPRFAQPQLIMDVWGPLGLVLPMLALGIGSLPVLRESGWFVIGGPLGCGMLAIGAAAMSVARSGRDEFFWSIGLTRAVTACA